MGTPVNLKTQVTEPVLGKGLHDSMMLASGPQGQLPTGLLDSIGREGARQGYICLRMLPILTAIGPAPDPGCCMLGPLR